MVILLEVKVLEIVAEVNEASVASPKAKILFPSTATITASATVP